MGHGGDIYKNKIKYDFSINLNPNELPERIIKAMEQSLNEISVYPDINQTDFRKNVADLENVLESEVLGGNGASEIIMGVVRAINPRKALLIAPSFSGYRYVLESIEGCEIEEFTLNEEEDFEVNTDILSAIDEFLDVIFVCNPNNPTGKGIDDYLLNNIINRAYSKNVSVVVDECFLPLAKKGKSVSNMVRYMDNLYVVKAFTKSFSLPGLRIGYLISNEDNIARVKSKLPEWNMSNIALKLGEECCKVFKETSYLKESLEIIDVEREYLTKELMSLNIKVYDSKANFLLINSNHPLYEMLLKKDILIRECSDYSGLDENYYRIAVKNHTENEYLINTLKELLRE